MTVALRLVCLLFVLCCYAVFVVCLNEEGLVLLSFKGSLKNSEISLTNWNSSDESPCSWSGVTCREEKVISLSIPNKNLSGFLPTSLGNLSALHHLNLGNNDLFGSLPPELFNAKGLQSLVLSGNSLSGNLPSQLGQLSYLQTLDLSENLINGSIPSSIFNCKKLKILVLGKNNFSGSLPDGFGTSLTNLQRLDLSFNRLSGSIPDDIGNLSNIRANLDMSHNLFRGPIPASLGSLPEAVYIDLSYNNLSGVIPQNGTLQNVGPTAFVGNHLLCGPPLKIPCSAGTSDLNSQSLVHNPTTNSGGNFGKRGKHENFCAHVLITIVPATLVGFCLILFLLTYLHKKVCSNKRAELVGTCKFEDRSTAKKDVFCFPKDTLETLSENMDQHKFVRLDLHFDFSLEQLLKASAYILCKSGTGILYKVVLEDGLALAVRRLGDGGSQRFKDFQTEVEAIGKIRHPNIVALRAYCWSIEEKLLIYDYIPNGDLATAIHGKTGILYFTPLSWPVRLKIMKGIAKGLAYLHDCSHRKYVHGNLKTSNILLGHNMEPIISDLGLGRIAKIAGEYAAASSFEQTATETTAQNFPHEPVTINSPFTVGSYYKAPEASKGSKPSQKWDVFSFGVILLEMISGKLPLIRTGGSEMELVLWFHLNIEESKPLLYVLDPYLANDLDMHKEIIAVLKIALACVDKSPERRPSIKFVFDNLARLI